MMEPDFSMVISGHELKYKEKNLKNIIFNYLFIAVSLYRLPGDVSESPSLRYSKPKWMRPLLTCSL